MAKQEKVTIISVDKKEDNCNASTQLEVMLTGSTTLRTSLVYYYKIIHRDTARISNPIIKYLENSGRH